VPVVKRGRGARRPVRKGGSRMEFDIKLAKLAIGDAWFQDEDGTKIFVNVAVENGKKYVRVRLDFPGDKPIIILWQPELAMQVANAIFRAAFNASVLTPQEIQQLWQRLRGQFRQPARRSGSGPARQQGGEAADDVPDVSFM
jgi:uncharacterized protein (DUF736 family)